VESTTARQILEFCMGPIMKNVVPDVQPYMKLLYSGATDSGGVW
jgi:hypothetical protein